MKKLFTLVILAVALAFMVSALVIAQDKKFAYVGAEKGCKMCHKAQFESWSATSHAKTWDKLKPEEQAKAECNVCHQTGAMADGTMITSVSCEACHGPGSEYKKPAIMSKKAYAADKAAARKAAVEAGLIMPTAETCTTKCHKKEGNPNFKPFDFEKAKGLVHPVKAAEEAPKG